MLRFLSTPDAAKLLRDATSQKEAGDLDGAIVTLRRAYVAIRKGETSYPVETFLRLPAYLQEAGRTREAWEAYGDLLAHGYPHQYDDSALLPMDHSVIYDKMRLFLQRAGRAVPAVAYGVLAHCSWAIGLCRQNRIPELHSHVAPSAIEKVVAALLKKARRGEAQQSLGSLVTERCRDTASLQLCDLFAEINSLLCVQPHEYA